MVLVVFVFVVVVVEEEEADQVAVVLKFEHALLVRTKSLIK